MPQLSVFSEKQNYKKTLKRKPRYSVRPYEHRSQQRWQYESIEFHYTWIRGVCSLCVWWTAENVFSMAEIALRDKANAATQKLCIVYAFFFHGRCLAQTKIQSFCVLSSYVYSAFQSSTSNSAKSHSKSTPPAISSLLTAHFFYI